MLEGLYYKTIEDFLKQEENNSSEFFLFVAEHTQFNIEDLESSSLNIHGVVVPQVIFNKDNYDTGIIACELSSDSEVHLLKLKTFKRDRARFSNSKSLIVLLDGLSPNISDFIDNLFESISIDTEIIGGGAGKLTLEQEPVIFSNNQIHQNAAIVISQEEARLTTGVENGWTYLEGPFLTTDIDKNILKTLNFRKAFDVYKEVVERDSGLKFNETNFFDIAKAYPFGMVKFNKEIVVRDPIALNDKNEIVLVGDIPPNSTVNILRGDKEELISSSKEAMKKAIKLCDDENIKNHKYILFDCISRTIFLEDDFKREIEGIQGQLDPSKNLFGALTLGEIANNGSEYLNFYNKTCVAGVLC